MISLLLTTTLLLSLPAPTNSVAVATDQLQAVVDLFNVSNITLPHSPDLDPEDLCESKHLLCDNETGNVLAFIGSIQFGGILPPSMKNLTYLETLDLSGSRLRMPSQWSTMDGLDFPFLQKFVCLGCLLTEFPSFILNLPQLQWLDLSFNFISGTLPGRLATLPLSTLVLGHNRFSSPLPPELPSSLSYLDLTNNKFSGPIPPSYSNLTALVYLCLYNNSLSGHLPALPQNLGFLELYGNQLSGAIPPSWGNSTALWHVVLNGNALTGPLPDFHIPYLRMFTAINNSITGRIPASLLQSSSLQYLDLTNNNLSGDLPPNISLPSLVSISLANNQLTGPFPIPLWSSPQIVYLNLSGNQFSGRLPDPFPSPKFQNGHPTLDLQGNYFTGPIPPSLLELTLQVLMLRNNLFNGTLNISYLRGQELYIDSNQLEGPLPFELFQNSSLRKLQIDNNSFTGTIPDGVTAVNLQYFGFSSNLFNGHLPAWIFRPPMVTLLGNNNNLTGHILCLPWSQLRYVDLSYNQFTGIPWSCISSTSSLKWIDLTSNSLDWIFPGNITHYSFSGGLSMNALRPSILKTLSLQYNQFSSFPDVSNLTNLMSIQLSNNRLSYLPSFANLPRLSFLDVSSNNLSGIVYPTFPFSLVTLYMSNNSFTGIDSSFVGQNVITFDISNNQISQSFYEVFSSMNETISLFNLANNRITGTFSIWNRFKRDIEGALREGRWETLLSQIDVTNNNLTNLIFPPRNLRPYLTTVILNGNQITGTLDDNLCGYPLVSVQLVDNPVLTELPDTIMPSYAAVTPIVDQHIECPTFICNTSTKIGLDISYLNYGYCRCVPGYYKNKSSNTDCITCLDNALCLGGDVLREANRSLIFAQPGYYPDPYGSTPYDDPTTMIPCRYFALLPQSPHNPCNYNISCLLSPDTPECGFRNVDLDIIKNSGTRFYCAPGSEGFLCSNCSKGYFSRQGRCLECSERAEFGLFLSIALLVLVISIIYFALTPVSTLERQPFDVFLGLGGILCDFFQTSTITLSKFESGQITEAILLPIIGAAVLTSPVSVGTGLECGGGAFAPFREFRNQFHFFVSFPPIYVSILAMAFICKYTFFKVFKHAVPLRNLFYSFIRATFTFLNFIFFPIVSFIINVFQCTPHRNGSYLSDRPYLACNYLPTTTKMGALGFYMLTVYFVFFSVIGYLSKVSDKSIRYKESWFQSFGFFFKEYRPSSIYAGIVFLTSRLALSLFVALVPSYHNYYPVLISCVMVIKILYLINEQPYLRKSWNRAHAMAEFTALLIFWNSYTNSPLFEQSLGPDIYYLLLNIICVCYISYVAMLEVQIHLPANRARLGLGAHYKDGDKHQNTGVTSSAMAIQSDLEDLPLSGVYEKGRRVAWTPLTSMTSPSMTPLVTSPRNATFASPTRTPQTPPTPRTPQHLQQTSTPRTPHHLQLTSLLVGRPQISPFSSSFCPSPSKQIEGKRYTPITPTMSSPATTMSSPGSFGSRGPPKRTGSRLHIPSPDKGEIFFADLTPSPGAPMPGSSQEGGRASPEAASSIEPGAPLAPITTDLSETSSFTIIHLPGER